LLVIWAVYDRIHNGFGAWLSLVEHRHGVAGVVGSNPTVPTKFFKSWIEISGFFILKNNSLAGFVNASRAKWGMFKFLCSGKLNLS